MEKETDTEKRNIEYIDKEKSDNLTKEAYLESQRFLSTLISNLPGYVYRCHEEDGIWCTQFASEGIYELTGFHAFEFLKGGKNAYAWLLHPEDKKMLSEVVKVALHKHEPYKITYRINTKDGTEKWVWEQGRGIYNQQGILTATEGFIIDISEKKLSEDELIKRNEELAAINHISLALSKLANQEEILELVHSMTSRLFNNNNIYIAFWIEHSNKIQFPIYLVDGEKIFIPEREFGNSFTEYVLKNKKPIIISRNVADKFKELGINFSGKESKSIMSVPITTGENIIGVITFQDYEKENAFSLTDLNLLSTIASQTAIALENSRLYTTLSKELEDKKKAEKKINASLREKEILLQEIHHRVKNNLQIISSLLRLQSSYVNHDETKRMFMESDNRIKSMSIIHNKLYNSKDYEHIDFSDYIRTLVTNLTLTYGINTTKIKVNIFVDELLINIDTAIPCGLIINELVSNSFKYAFPGGRKGNVNVQLTKIFSGKYQLIVEDDGIGLPENFNIESNISLGMKLVILLTKQLDGTFEYKAKKGTQFKIEFEEAKYKERRKEAEDINPL